MLDHSSKDPREIDLVQFNQLAIEVRSTDDVTFRLITYLMGSFTAFMLIIMFGAPYLSVFALASLSLLASVVTLALMAWDLRNIQVCYSGVRQLSLLETSIGTRVKTYALGSGSGFGKLVSKRIALKVIYSAVNLVVLLVSSDFLSSKVDAMPLAVYMVCCGALTSANIHMVFFVQTRSPTKEVIHECNESRFG